MVLGGTAYFKTWFKIYDPGGQTLSVGDHIFRNEESPRTIYFITYRLGGLYISKYVIRVDISRGDQIRRDSPNVKLNFQHILLRSSLDPETYSKQTVYFNVPSSSLVSLGLCACQPDMCMQGTHWPAGLQWHDSPPFWCFSITPVYCMACLNKHDATPLETSAWHYKRENRKFYHSRTCMPVLKTSSRMSDNVIKRTG